MIMKFYVGNVRLGDCLLLFEKVTLAKKSITELKVDYAHILVNEMLLKPDSLVMQHAWMKISAIDDELRSRGHRTKITISTEPWETNK